MTSLEGMSTDDRIILKWISKQWDREVWTDMAQNKDKWWAFVNAVTKFRVP
jgi:hypothetical protein